MPPKAKGDGGSAAQKRPGAPLPDTVRARKNSSTPIASETTADKGAPDKSTKMSNRNLAQGQQNDAVRRPLQILIRCGMHFRSTQMGPCNGFPSSLWQLVRTFTVKLVIAKSELLFTKFVGKDTTRRTTPGSPSHIYRAH
jgi:hypothetical protein